MNSKRILLPIFFAFFLLNLTLAQEVTNDWELAEEASRKLWKEDKREACISYLLKVKDKIKLDKGELDPTYAECVTGLANYYIAMQDTDQYTVMMEEVSRVTSLRMIEVLKKQQEAAAEQIKQQQAAESKRLMDHLYGGVAENWGALLFRFSAKQAPKERIALFEASKEKLGDPELGDYQSIIMVAEAYEKVGNNQQSKAIYSKYASFFEGKKRQLPTGHKDHPGYDNVLMQLYAGAGNEKKSQEAYNSLHGLNTPITKEVSSWDELYETLMKKMQQIGISSEKKNTQVVQLFEANENKLFTQLSLNDYSMVTCVSLVSNAYNELGSASKVNSLNQRKFEKVKAIVENGDRSHENFSVFATQLYSLYQERGETQKAKETYALFLEQSIKSDEQAESEETDDLFRRIQLAQLKGDHQGAIDLYDKNNAGRNDESTIALDQLIHQSFKALDLKERVDASNARMQQYAARQMEQMAKDDPDVAAKLAMMQRMQEQAEAQAELYQKKYATQAIEGQAQIASIKDRIGVVDSANRFDPNDAYKQAAPYLKMMIEGSDLNESKKKEALQLAEQNDMGSYMKIVAMIQGVSDEEMQLNMQEYAQKVNNATGENSIDIDEGDDLQSMYSKINTHRENLVEESQSATNRIMDRYDEGLYNPDIIRENLKYSIALFEAVAWPDSVHYQAMEKAKEENETDQLSVTESSDLFVSSLKKIHPQTSEEEADRLASKFNEGVQAYFEAIKKLAPDVELLQEIWQPISGENLEMTYQINAFDAYLDGKPLVKNLPILKTAYQAYSEATNLIDKREINDLRFESNQLEEMGKYRNTNMNIALTLMQSSDYNPFDTTLRETGITGYNEILAAKGADYRAKRFLIEGVKSSNDAKVKSDYESLRNLSRELGQIHLLPKAQLDSLGWTDERFLSEIERANRLKTSIYKRIAQSSNFAAFAKKWIITWEEIQSILNSNEAFVDIYRIESLKNDSLYTYLYFILEKNNKPKWFYNVKDSLDIESHFEDYRDKVNRHVIDKKADSLFWAPIRENLDSAVNKVFLSSDGIYHNIALSGIYNPSTKGYLVDEVAIEPVVEVSDLKRIKSRVKEPEPIEDIYLFGFPNYRRYPVNEESNSDQRRSLSFFNGRLRLRPLTGSKAEVESIAQIAEAANISSVMLKEEQASESKFKSLNGPSIIHLATHGKFYGKEGTSDADEVFQEKKIKFDENPLLRSHIYLAGSQNALLGRPFGEQDGIVTGEEVSHMDLTGTQLVVLSACESGLGQTFTGDGVFGLQRAFLQAGVKNLIITLWEVDDYATKEFMEYFYHHWLIDGLSIREAFNTAQLELKNKRPLPGYWAPFILLGE